MSDGVSADAVEQQLLHVIDEIRTTMIVLEDFKPDSQEHLNTCLNELLADCVKLDNLQANSAFCSEPLIPLDIVDFVDQGHNPDLFTEQKLASQAELMNIVKSKQETLATFRGDLIALLADAYPDETREYLVHQSGQPHDQSVADAVTPSGRAKRPRS